MSGGGSASKSQSKQSSNSFTDPAQAPYLEQLRSGAMGAMASLPSMAPLFQRAESGSQQLSNMRFTDPFAAYQPQQQALQAFSGANPYAQQLAGTFTGGATQGIEGVISNLGDDINRQLQRMMGGAGGINTSSALAGTLGGGRNQVERGIAQEGALNTFGTQAGNIRAQDFQQAQQRQLAALQSAGGMYGQGAGLDLEALRTGVGATGQALGTQLQQGLGQGQLQTQAGALGFAPFAGQMSLWEQLANIIGPPNVLQKSKGKSQSASMSGYGGLTGP